MNRKLQNVSRTEDKNDSGGLYRITSLFDSRDFSAGQRLTVVQEGHGGLYNVTYKAVAIEGKAYWEFVSARQTD